MPTSPTLTPTVWRRWTRSNTRNGTLSTSLRNWSCCWPGCRQHDSLASDQAGSVQPGSVPDAVLEAAVLSRFRPAVGRWSKRVSTVTQIRSAETLRSFERATMRRLQAGVDTSRGHSNEAEANHARLHGPDWRTRGCARAVIRPDLRHGQCGH